MGQRSEGSRWSPAQALLCSVWEPGVGGGNEEPAPRQCPAWSSCPQTQNHRAARSWAGAQSHNLTVLARLGGDIVTTDPPRAAPCRLPVRDLRLGQGKSLPTTPAAPTTPELSLRPGCMLICVSTCAQFPPPRAASGDPEAPGCQGSTVTPPNPAPSPLGPRELLLSAARTERERGSARWCSERKAEARIRAFNGFLGVESGGGVPGQGCLKLQTYPGDVDMGL